MRIALEFDDFSPRNTNFGILESLKEHYPGFKVSLFTVVWNVAGVNEQTPITDAKFLPFVNAIKESPWIEIVVHGFAHVPLEFANLNYDDARKRIMVAEKMLQNRGIEYKKIFKAPMWAISEEAEAAAESLGFQVVHDGYYHWNLNSDQVRCKDGTHKHFLDVPKNELVIAHGHIQDVCGNGLQEVFPMLMKLPVDTEFIFISQALEELKS